MRYAIVVALLALPTSSFATGAYGYSETLVGWSDDGERYAIVRGIGPAGPSQLEVREKPDKPNAEDKVLATFKAGENGVPEDSETAGADRVDVEKFKPLAKYKLKRIDSKSRDRFKADFELAAIGTRIDRYNCKNGGWTFKRKGGKPIREVKAVEANCFQPLGGYVHANGKRALVKLTETSFSSSEEHGSSSNTETKFVLVELPPK